MQNHHHTCSPCLETEQCQQEDLHRIAHFKLCQSVQSRKTVQLPHRLGTTLAETSRPPAKERAPAPVLERRLRSAAERGLVNMECM